MNSLPKPHPLTVIICTYNRGYILEECLHSLKQQTVPLDSFNVIVIDNNSSDDTQELLTSLAVDWPTLRLVFEKEQGLSHARNRGMAEAATDWIAFLDSDAKAHPDWIETIFSVIEKGDFDCFGGPYYAWHHFGPPPAWLPESFGTYEGRQGYGPLDEAKAHIPGGNCAFRRDAALAAGSFPTDIGMTGDKCAYGEETLLFHRMKRAGFRLGYAPAMKIDHCVLPYKYQFSWVMKSYFARGEAQIALVKSDTPAWQLLKESLRCLFLFGKSGGRLALSFCSGWKPQHKQKTVQSLMHSAFAAGRVWGAALLAIGREK